MKRGKIIKIDGEKLKQERLDCEISQLKLAKRSNITRQSLISIERTGSCHEPTGKRIVQVLNTPVIRGSFIRKRIKPLKLEHLFDN